MTKKLLIPLVAALAITGLTPAVGQADKVADVQREINQIRQQSQAAKAKVGTINQQITSLQSQQQDTKEDIMSIDLKMNETQAKIDQLTKQIETTTVDLQAAAKELQAAMERVQKRDKLLKTRVVAIYEAGDISYLEVLLGSQDFADFLERLDAVKSIVDQDVTILEDNKRDRDIIEKRKNEIQANLTSLKSMQAENQQLMAEMEVQKAAREKILKELEKQEGDLLEIKEEHEQAALELVNQLQRKLDEQNQTNSGGGSGGGTPSFHGNGELSNPLPGARLSSPFGYRIHPILKTRKFHDGQDMAAPQGTTIMSAGDGVVASTGYMNGYGNTVVIYHGNGLSTLYAHIRNGGIMVSEGQSVKAGQKIAEVGATGRATGPHLHFTVIKSGQKVNPMSYLH